MLIAWFIDMLSGHVGRELIGRGLIVLVFQNSMAKVAMAGPLSSDSSFWWGFWEGGGRS